MDTHSCPLSILKPVHMDRTSLSPCRSFDRRQSLVSGHCTRLKGCLREDGSGIITLKKNSHLSSSVILQLVLSWSPPLLYRVYPEYSWKHCADIKTYKVALLIAADSTGLPPWLANTVGLAPASIRSLTMSTKFLDAA